MKEGGHDVPEEEILVRYHNGLQNFDKIFFKYDKVVLIDTSSDANILLLEITNAKLSYIHENLIEVIFAHQLTRTINWLQSTLDNWS